MIFPNRYEAGQLLAKHLEEFRNQKPVVLAIPRGGVEVAKPVATFLKVPINVIVARKIGAPNQPELGVGAVAEGGIKLLNEELIRNLSISGKELAGVIRKENAETLRRAKLYRKNKPLPNLTDKTVILVDDGLATGISAKAAILSLKSHKVNKVILAVPVCSDEAFNDIRPMVSKIIYLEKPDYLASIGNWYQNFEQLTDEQVLRLLNDPL